MRRAENWIQEGKEDRNVNCDKCGAMVEEKEKVGFRGQILCEDCHMDALSPARPCDPWAVYTAKSLSTPEGAVSGTQEKILKILEETGGVEPNRLAEMLQIKMAELEREFAALRHMEKARGKMKDGKKIICLW
jgi:hypothetical protein